MRKPALSGEVIVFHRPLIPGFVKTRLAAAVGHNTAIEIYRAMLEDTKTNLADYADRLIPFVSMDLAPEGELFWPDSFLQRGGDLGERMANAFVERFENGASAAVLIGSDIPTVDTDLINRYFRQLVTNDVVIGPSDDGGYYLIGFTSKSFCRNVFEDIPWSTDRVFEFTEHRASEAGLNVWVGQPLTDIDTEEDLQRVIESHHRSGKIDHLLTAWNGVWAGRVVSIGETG